MPDTFPESDPNGGHRLAIGFTHVGIYVHVLAPMVRFYRDLLGLMETDRGMLGEAELVFLSSDPTEHHQLVLVTGRPETIGFNCVNQISFRVEDLPSLREIYRRARIDPAISDLVSVTHGNAISIYMRDPEGNRNEIFCNTPWHCQQPVREPINLEDTDEDVLAAVEAIARRHAGFQARPEWSSSLARRMERAKLVSGLNGTAPGPAASDQ